MPKSRIEGKTLDLEALRRGLQGDLNEKCGVYNVVLDTFLRMFSANLVNVRDMGNI